jgi:hypothetical protein
MPAVASCGHGAQVKISGLRMADFAHPFRQAERTAAAATADVEMTSSTAASPARPSRAPYQLICRSLVLRTSQSVAREIHTEAPPLLAGNRTQREHATVQTRPGIGAIAQGRSLHFEGQAFLHWESLQTIDIKKVTTDGIQRRWPSMAAIPKACNQFENPAVYSLN